MGALADKPYTALAEVYDRLMEDVPYDEWVAHVDGLLRELPGAPDLTVCDLGCGTGNIALRLASLGYGVVGVDGSSAMLAQAARKAIAAKLWLNLMEQDFRQLNLLAPVDAVVSLYDSLNYLPTQADLATTFRAVAANLKPGGLFVFDLNSPVRLRDIGGRTVFLIEKEGFALRWQNRYLPHRACWQATLTGSVREAGGSLRRFREVHREYAHEPGTVGDLLAVSRLELAGMFDGFSRRPATAETGRLVFVAHRMLS